MLKLHIKEGTFSNSHVAGTVSEFDVQRLLGSKIQTSDVFFSPLDASFHPNFSAQSGCACPQFGLKRAEGSAVGELFFLY